MSLLQTLYYTLVLSFAFVIYILDTTVPLGFAIGVLFIIPTVFAAFLITNKKAFFSVIGIFCVLVFAGMYHSQGALLSAAIITNRVLSVFIVIFTGFLSYFMVQTFRRTSQIEAKFKVSVEAAPNGMLMVGNDGKIQLVNEAIEKMFGYKKEELLGKPVEILVPDSIRPKHPGLREGFFKKPLPRQMGAGRDLRGKRKDGSEFSIEIGLNPIETERGIIVLSSIIDISDRKELEQVIAQTIRAETESEVTKQKAQALQKAYDFSNSIINTMLDTLLFLTPEGSIQQANPALMNLLGYQENELLGKPVGFILAEEEEEEEEEEASPFKHTSLKRLLKKGYIKGLELSFQSKNGHIIPMSFSGAVMRDKEDKIVGIVGIAKDMREYNLLMEQAKNAAAASASLQTEREKAVELEKANKELKSAQSQLIHAEKMTAVGILAAGAAHELNNPLGGCQGIVEVMLRKTDKKEKSYSRLSLIHRQLIHCTKIVSNLLAFSRSKKAPLERMPVQCNDAIIAAFETIKFHFEKGDVKVSFDLDDHLPTIFAASNQLQQVMINLLTNAKYSLEHSDKKLKEIKVVSKQQGLWVVIEVSDNGSGMTEEVLGKLFDPFFTTKGVGEGTGLGLSVSHGIIRDQGGEISVKSKMGQGSTFIIKLPTKKIQKKAA